VPPSSRLNCVGSGIGLAIHVYECCNEDGHSEAREGERIGDLSGLKGTVNRKTALVRAIILILATGEKWNCENISIFRCCKIVFCRGGKWKSEEKRPFSGHNIVFCRKGEI
jgi:hypothetical protein